MRRSSFNLQQSSRRNTIKKNWGTSKRAVRQEKEVASAVRELRNYQERPPATACKTIYKFSEIPVNVIK